MSVKCLIYCTKAKPYISYDSYDNTVWEADKEYSLNGTIVASFDCEKIERFDVPYPVYFGEVKDKLEHITKGSCLSLMNLHHYLGDKSGYVIHISNLEIFDKPKELNKYSKRLPNGDFQVLGNAPQNMMNVCEIKYLIEDYVLISIKPEHIAKILTGKKTIEVRKKVVNKLKELI